MAYRDATEAPSRRCVADASHELRTPLATIRANAEYGSATELGALPEQTIDALKDIISAADRMGMLVADLLLADFDSGRPRQSATVDLTRLVLDTVAEAHVAGPTAATSSSNPTLAVERAFAPRFHCGKATSERLNRRRCLGPDELREQGSLVAATEASDVVGPVLADPAVFGSLRPGLGRVDAGLPRERPGILLIGLRAR